MKMPLLLAIAVCTGMVALLTGCAFQQSSTPTAPPTYQWVTVESDYSSPQLRGMWQWNDTSILLQDTTAMQIRSVGHADGALVQGGAHMCWPATSPIQLSMNVNLSSVDSDAAAITVLDSVNNRRYWLIAGNNGIGQAAAGVLSVIITEAGNSQAIISQAHQTIQNLSADTYYRLVLTLYFSSGVVGDSNVVGEIQLSGSRITFVQVSNSPISSSNTGALCPGVDLVGTTSSPVYASAFQVEIYQVIYSGGGGGGSCPLVYSFDGKRYYRESETFAGAIFKAAERAEYDRLYMLRPINGKCLLRIANELPEDHFINQVALVTVDAPKGIEPIFDNLGIPHSLSHPVIPRFCTDFTGRDVLDCIARHDSLLWKSDLTARDFADSNAGHDGLILSFDKPSGAQNMKLVVDGINTYLEIFTMELAFRHMGSKRKALYDELEKDPTRQNELLALMNKEAGLHISLWREGRWQECARLRDVGPLVQKQQVAIIDVHNVNESSIKVKLESATDLWRIDRVYADFTPDVEMAVHESAPDVAQDQANRDIRSLLAASDSLYYKNRMGEHATLIFNDIPKSSGHDRFYFVKAAGYYHNRLNTPEQKQALSWNDILFGADLNGKEFWDSWIKAKTRYQ